MYSLFTAARFAALNSTSISGTSVSPALLSTVTTLPESLKAFTSHHTARRVGEGEHCRRAQHTGGLSGSSVVDLLHDASHVPRHGLHVDPTHPIVALFCPSDLHCLGARVHDLQPLAILDSVACHHHVHGH